ncbi:hypothetical protein OXYTRIMIC_795 [Oxytricha trifallax]|uniref:Uncharacterized protein n=1 Tax=Oxytricha trifallax TaxID=1172189 RepID=A0A073I0Q8_9SPIT|nr:hypothetical protein OXYTRIMIC_795 [Oxytricha trifallax]
MVCLLIGLLEYCEIFVGQGSLQNRPRNAVAGLARNLQFKFIRGEPCWFVQQIS